MCWVPAGSERLWPDNGAVDARRTELKQKSDVRGFRTSLFLASSPPFRNRLGESGLSGLSLRFGLFAAAARIGLARRRSFIGAWRHFRSPVGAGNCVLPASAGPGVWRSGRSIQSADAV